MKCIREGCKNDAIDSPTYGILPCAACQKLEEQYSPTRLPEFSTISRMDRINRKRDKHARDLIQPFLRNEPNPDFVKAYRGKATQYFTKDELKNF